MTSSYTSRLKLERQATGANSGNWGNLVNYVLNRIDSTVRGYVAASVAGSANVTLVSNTSTTNTDDSTTDDQVHNKVIEFTGALTGSIYVFTDAVEGDYTLFNNTTGSHTLTFANTGHAANGVVITQGTKSIVYTDGSTIYDVAANLGQVGVTSLTSTTDITATGNVTSGAITATGNVTSGAITATGNIVPGANDTYDLGASGNVWRNLYTGDLHLSNQAKDQGNMIDGTKGNWTLQEGENDIFMINNISGEKFKINLSKIKGDF